MDEDADAKVVMRSTDADIEESQSYSVDDQSMDIELECTETMPLGDEALDTISDVGSRFSNITVKQEPIDAEYDKPEDFNVSADVYPEHLTESGPLNDSDNQPPPLADYESIRVKVIEVPEDEDLFSFENNPKPIQIDEPLSPENEIKTEEEMKQSELYRYLTVNDPTSLRSLDNTPEIRDIKRELRSCEQTPIHSGDECDSVHSASELSKDTETSDLETPEKRCTPEPILRQRRKPVKRSVTANRRKKAAQGPVLLSSKTRERLEKSRSVTEKWLNDLQLPETVSLTQKITLTLGDLNKYMTCGMCRGYLYEASTITECMHTFCKNCIVRHCMEVSLHCPVCHILIHPTDPFVNIRLDRMIQDIVYKILPSVAQTEMRRIEEFYATHPEVEQTVELEKPKSPKSSPKEKEDIPQPEMVSLVLEQEGEAITRDILEKKFVRVAGTATIRHVFNFLKMKLSLSHPNKVELYCCGDIIEDPTVTLTQLQDKFFTRDDGLILLQYRVADT